MRVRGASIDWGSLESLVSGLAVHGVDDYAEAVRWARRLDRLAGRALEALRAEPPREACPRVLRILAGMEDAVGELSGAVKSIDRLYGFSSTRDIADTLYHSLYERLRQADAACSRVVLDGEESAASRAAESLVEAKRVASQVRRRVEEGVLKTLFVAEGDMEHVLDVLRRRVEEAAGGLERVAGSCPRDAIPGYVRGLLDEALRAVEEVAGAVEEGDLRGASEHAGEAFSIEARLSTEQHVPGELRPLWRALYRFMEWASMQLADIHTLKAAARRAGQENTARSLAGLARRIADTARSLARLVDLAFRAYYCG